MILRKLVERLGFEPVDDVANWHKWWSAKLDAAALMVGSVALAYSQLPDDWQRALPHGTLTVLASVGLAIKSAALIVRGVKQKALQKDPPTDA